MLENILKENKIEVVISAIGGGRISDQLILVDAIKAVGTVKVLFYPYKTCQSILFIYSNSTIFSKFVC